MTDTQRRERQLSAFAQTATSLAERATLGDLLDDVAGSLCRGDRHRCLHRGPLRREHPGRHAGRHLWRLSRRLSRAAKWLPSTRRSAGLAGRISDARAVRRARLAPSGSRGSSVVTGAPRAAGSRLGRARGRAPTVSGRPDGRADGVLSRRTVAGATQTSRSSRRSRRLSRWLSATIGSSRSWRRRRR